VDFTPTMVGRREIGKNGLLKGHLEGKNVNLLAGAHTRIMVLGGDGQGLATKDPGGSGNGAGGGKFVNNGWWEFHKQTGSFGIPLKIKGAALEIYDRYKPSKKEF